MAESTTTTGFAGQSFGFPLPGVSEDGEAQTTSILARYFPELSLSFSAKGKRGGRLGRGDTAQTATQATMKPLPEAPTFNITQTASPVMTASPTVNVGSQPTAKRTPSLEYGQSAERFGLEDYWRNLEKGFSREEIKEYVLKTPDILAAQNIKGGGGLYDWLEKGEAIPYPGMGSASAPKAAAPTPTPTPQPKTFSTAYGQDPNYFGGEDAREALKSGASQAEILDFLNRSGPSKLLRLQNLPGGGGLYDQLKAGTFK